MLSDFRIRGGFRIRVVSTLLLLGAASGPAVAQEPPDAAPGGMIAEVAIEAPAVVLADVPFDVRLSGADVGVALVPPVLVAGGQRWTLGADGDGLPVYRAVRVSTTGSAELRIESAAGEAIATAQVRVLPGLLSVLPPVLAITVALLFRQVVPALFLGLWVGATTLIGFTPTGVFLGMLRSFQVFVLGAITDPNQASIVLFSFMIGGMVGIIIKNGGMQGVVNIIVRFATDARRGQVAAATLGMVIFFDDYANTLVVGNTMRQITDRLRISREKLAYIVDSTAAPVACLALVTTWIGYQVGMIGAAVAAIPDLDVSPYQVFLSSIPYSFYPFFAVFMVFVIATTGRDFGPMRAAEIRSRTTGQVFRPGASIDAAAADGAEFALEEGRPIRAINALLPLVVLIFGVLIGLYATGTGDNLRDIIGSADSYRSLMWASLTAVLVAGVMSVSQRILTATEVVDAWYAGLKSMLFAMIILVLAWALAGVSRELHTADYLVSTLSDALSPAIVPTLVFVLAGATAFATGSSWATMGILMPLVLPLVWAVMNATHAGPEAHMHALYSTVACVLAGAVFGDHCSPISDTTILSSMASGCDHIDHVRTQLPYAGLAGGVALLAGTLPTGFGVPWWISMAVGLPLIWAAVRYLGRPVADT